MSNFVNQWQVLKSQFGKEVLTLIKAGGADVSAEVRSEIIELVKLDTGMSPALKLVDAAIGKDDAVAAMKALNKVHKVIEKTDKVFQHAFIGAMNAAADSGADSVEKIARRVGDFNKEFKSFEKSVSEAIEFLQEKKSGVKLLVFSLEGDLKGDVKRFESKISSKECKALEKKYKVMSRVDDAKE